MSRELQVAWAAGFLDGEGHLGLGVNTGKYRGPKITASQVRVDPLLRLQDLFGGSVSNPANRLTRSGRMYVWSIWNGAAVRVALLELRPHLVLKQKDANLLLEYIANMRLGGGGRLSPDQLEARADVLRRYDALRAAI